MPVAPRGSILTLTDGVTTSNIAVSAIISTPKYQSFRRDEFNNALLKQAPNSDGSVPQYQQTASGKVFQYFSNCSLETVRPTSPNTLTNLDNILKRFDSRIYEIAGDVSLYAELVKLYNFAKDHQSRLARFEFQLQAVKELVSYQDLVNFFQAETLSYLTTTGLTMSGRALSTHGPVSNCLITDFSIEPSYELPDDAANTSSTVLAVWRMKIETRNITALRTVGWTGV